MVREGQQTVQKGIWMVSLLLCGRPKRWVSKKVKGQVHYSCVRIVFQANVLVPRDTNIYVSYRLIWSWTESPAKCLSCSIGSTDMVVVRNTKNCVSGKKNPQQLCIIEGKNTLLNPHSRHAHTHTNACTHAHIITWRKLTTSAIAIALTSSCPTPQCCSTICVHGRCSYTFIDGSTCNLAHARWYTLWHGVSNFSLKTSISSAGCECTHVSSSGTSVINADILSWSLHCYILPILRIAAIFCHGL